MTLRGDTDFSQSAYLDGWDEAGVRFVFGYDNHPNLVKAADSLDSGAWKPLAREPKYEVQTAPRSKPREPAGARPSSKRGPGPPRAHRPGAWPGAPTTRVEELITDPIEDVIVEIAEVETVRSKSMVGLSVVQVSAGDHYRDSAPRFCARLNRRTSPHRR